MILFKNSLLHSTSTRFVVKLTHAMRVPCVQSSAPISRQLSPLGRGWPRLRLVEGEAVYWTVLTVRARTMVRKSESLFLSWTRRVCLARTDSRSCSRTRRISSLRGRAMRSLSLSFYLLLPHFPLLVDAWTNGMALRQWIWIACSRFTNSGPTNYIPKLDLRRQ